ncbi:DNA helicase [Bacteroidia bacterium]|nr:DNA helicase [Bacteroidia bacterium]
MASFLAFLNLAQREAAKNYEGASLVIAGAGSGKTRVLTYRIAYMLAKGVSPYTVMALTFTNKAAREMRERIASLIDPKVAHSLWMGTFHSIFARILRIEAESLGFTNNFSIYDPTDSKSLIRTIVREMELDEKIYRDKAIHDRISDAKNHLITPALYANNSERREIDRMSRLDRLHEIYDIYARRCKTANAMDFDDLLLFTNVLFRDFPETLQKYAERFKYILVDEYQDTNLAQYSIVKLLSQHHQNLCVVGDDAQSIYSFRGANIQNILNFKKDYPDCKVYKLEQNYRSTQNIVNAANSLISKNEQQLHKQCFSEGEEGEKLTVFQTLSDQEEGLRVVADIANRYYTEHLQYSDFAILYRTNAQSRIFEDCLRHKNIPYRIHAGMSFYQRKEIKDLLAYLRLAVNHRDNEAFKRIVNYPKRGIGDTTLSRIEISAAQKQLSLWDAILGLTPEQADVKGMTYKKLSNFLLMIDSMHAEAAAKNAYELAVEVANKSGILEDLRAEKTMENISKLENIEELLNSVKAFCENYKEENGSDPNIEQYLETVSLLTEDDNDNDNKNTVTLMTVHAAKGLEFGYVYVVGLEEGLFPSQNTFSLQQNLEEERRLCYVAITRAKTKATLSFAQSRFKWGNHITCTPSRFISELDPRYVNTPIYVADVRTMSYNSSEDSNYSFAYKKAKPAPTNQYTFAANANLKAIPKSGYAPSFHPENYDAVKEGATVEHERFGRGKVVSIDGAGADARVTIQFALAGQKTLLLKFAKLAVVN